MAKGKKKPLKYLNPFVSILICGYRWFPVDQLTWAARVNCSAKKNSASTPGPELNEHCELSGFDDLGRVWVADNAGLFCLGSVKDSRTLLNCAATFVANIGLSCGEKLKAVPHMGEWEFQLIRSKRSSRVAAANSSVPTTKFREPVTPVTLWLFSELRTGKPPLKW